MTKRHDWIIACDGTDPKFPYGFACLRCRKREELPPGRMRLTDYLEKLRRFEERHKDCKEPGTEGE